MNSQIIGGNAYFDKSHVFATRTDSEQTMVTEDALYGMT